MRLFCREDHDEPEDRCPPHVFVGAAWDDEDGGHGAIFCQMCAEVRPLKEPTFAAPDMERVGADAG